MASKFQSRLIGTVILVAVGVIVLPDVFDGQKKHYQEDFAAIPIKPTDEVAQSDGNQGNKPNAENKSDADNKDSEHFSLKDQDVKKPEALDVLPAEPVKTVTVDDTPAKSEPAKPIAPEQKPKPDPKPQPVKTAEAKPAPVRETNQYSESAWIIQLVSLKNKDNATKLVQDLQKRGYSATLRTDGAISRVMVGPDVSKEKMQQQVDELQKITGLKGQLQTFKPFKQ
ncbi:MAG: cell division protein DedD [Vibrio sp.]